MSRTIPILPDIPTWLNLKNFFFLQAFVFAIVPFADQLGSSVRRNVIQAREEELKCLLGALARRYEDVADIIGVQQLFTRSVCVKRWMNAHTAWSDDTFSVGFDDLFSIGRQGDVRCPSLRSEFSACQADMAKLQTWRPVARSKRVLIARKYDRNTIQRPLGFSMSDEEETRHWTSHCSERRQASYVVTGPVIIVLR